MTSATDTPLGVAELLLNAGMVAWEAPVAGGSLTVLGDPMLLRGVAPRTLADLIDQVQEQDRERLLRAIAAEGGPARDLAYRVRHPERGLVAVHAVVSHRSAGGHELVTVIEGADAPLAADDAQARSTSTDAERFLHICSHDLREPLRMVTGFLGLLSRRSQGMSPAQLEHLATALDGAYRLDRMFEGLLKLTRCGRNRSDAVVKLDEAVALARERVAKLPEAPGAHWRIEPLPAVWGDRDQVVELLYELFKNALIFRKGDPAEIGIRAVGGSERMATIAVTDSGIGIPESGRERVFTVFQRLRQKEGAEGCGVGLALCAKIVLQHRGRIWVESGSPGATDIRFTLPRASSAAPALTGR